MEEEKLVKGIIFGVPIDITEDEIQEETNADAVKRMKRRVDGNLENTPNVVISYKECLPELVQIGFLRFKVKDYIPRPFRCTKCQMFGHGAQACWRPSCCPRCSGGHDFSHCPVKAEEHEQHKCRNCHGNHSSAWTGCPVYQNVHEALEIKIKEKMTYKQALERVKTHHKDERSREHIIATDLKKTQLTTAVHQKQHELEHATTLATPQNPTNTITASHGSPLEGLLKICVVGLLLCIESITKPDETKLQKLREIINQQAMKCGINITDTESLLSTTDIIKLIA